MNRRQFLKSLVTTSTLFGVAGLVGCGKETSLIVDKKSFLFTGTRLVMYDTNAMALYFDGGLGPKTGIIKVDYLIKNEPVTLTFWHGHNGRDHEFTVTPEHIKELKKMKKVFIETTEVADHTHKLFIDFSDPRWRVPGAEPIEVPET